MSVRNFEDFVRQLDFENNQASRSWYAFDEDERHSLKFPAFTLHEEEGVSDCDSDSDEEELMFGGKENLFSRSPRNPGLAMHRANEVSVAIGGRRSTQSKSASSDHGTQTYKKRIKWADQPRSSPGLTEMFPRFRFTCSPRPISRNEKRSDEKTRRRSESPGLDQKRVIEGCWHTTADPYQWAYDVWKKKGLIGRNPTLTPSKQNPVKATIVSTPTFQMMSDEEEIQSKGSRSPAILSARTGQPLSASRQTKKRSTEGQRRANRLSAESPNDFANVMKEWRRKSIETSEKPSFLGSGSKIANGRADQCLKHSRECACFSSVFSGNSDQMEFFLPQLGMACTCGKQQQVPCWDKDSGDDPTNLEYILRPWQVEFLKSYGIRRGDQLVKAHHRSANILAKSMRKWRQRKGMKPDVKTVSCGIALNVWASTCKSYVRSVRRQLVVRGDNISDKINTTSILGGSLSLASKVARSRRVGLTVNINENNTAEI